MHKYFILLITLIVVGCSAKPLPPPVVKIEFEYITYEIPEQFVTPCKPKPPISEARYLAMSSNEKQRFLSNYIVELMGDLKKCDNKVQTINKYVKEHNRLITEQGDKKSK